MYITMREFRQMIAENCDFSQPLRVIANDVGKKAHKHSVVRVDEDHRVRMSVQRGMYDERGIVEFAYDEEADVLMPQHAIDILDDLIEEDPKAHIGFVYFFYFPIDALFLFGRVRRVDNSLLDTNKVQDIRFSEDEPNTLIITAPYGIGEFDV